MNQVNENKNPSGERVESPSPALERCPHCGRFVPDVYLHTSLEDCEVINKQIGEIMDGTLKF